MSEFVDIVVRLIQDNSTISIIIGAITAYLVFLFCSSYLVFWIWGGEVTQKYSAIVGFPIGVLIWLGQGIWWVLYSPWRIRYRRIFRETLGDYVGYIVDPYTCSYAQRERLQQQLDTHLKSLARDCFSLFQEQERQSRANIPISNDLNGRIDQAKAKFWQHHKAARQVGLIVFPKIADYEI